MQNEQLQFRFVQNHPRIIDLKIQKFKKKKMNKFLSNPSIFNRMKKNFCISKILNHSNIHAQNYAIKNFLKSLNICKKETIFIT